MVKRKKINQELITTLVSDNGEIISESKITSSYVEREPDYIKLYIGDILKLSNISKGTNEILFSILKRVNYENEVYLLVSTKAEIAKELNLKIVTINKAVTELTEANILIRKARGHYTINPYLFGRGKWEDIRQIRLELVYDNNGRRIHKVELEKSNIIEDFGNENKEKI